MEKNSYRVQPIREIYPIKKLDNNLKDPNRQSQKDGFQQKLKEEINKRNK